MPIDIKPSGRTISVDELAKESKPIIPARSTAKTNQYQPEQDENDKKRAKFYLPVLRINDPTQWESKPLSERTHFTDEEAKKTCVGNCCGVEGLKAGCCQLGPDDLEHVLGPLDEDWISKTIKWS